MSKKPRIDDSPEPPLSELFGYPKASALKRSFRKADAELRRALHAGREELLSSETGRASLNPGVG
jgi:hypothetical protein